MRVRIPESAEGIGDAEDLLPPPRRSLRRLAIVGVSRDEGAVCEMGRRKRGDVEENPTSFQGSDDIGEARLGAAQLHPKVWGEPPMVSSARTGVVLHNRAAGQLPCQHYGVIFTSGLFHCRPHYVHPIQPIHLHVELSRRLQHLDPATTFQACQLENAQ